MADIDVEKVLSELTLGEKVSLTAGLCYQPCHFPSAPDSPFVPASVDTFAMFSSDVKVLRLHDGDCPPGMVPPLPNVLFSIKTPFSRPPPQNSEKPHGVELWIFFD